MKRPCLAPRVALSGRDDTAAGTDRLPRVGAVAALALRAEGAGMDVVAAVARIAGGRRHDLVPAGFTWQATHFALRCAPSSGYFARRA